MKEHEIKKQLKELYQELKSVPEAKKGAILREISALDKALGNVLMDKSSAKVAVQINLFPEYENGKAAMPNAIARSALFASVCPGRRKYHQKVMIASRKDAEIRYSGQQLDIGDSDVFMQAIRTIKHLDLGTNIQMFPYGFLREMGRVSGKKKKAGKTDKKWLDRAFERLTEGTLFVHVPGKYKVVLHLIDEYIHDENTDAYYIRVNPKAVNLFQKEQYGLIDWEARKEIKIPLAKWLQTYASSNAANLPQIITLKKLKVWCGQENRRPDHFKTTVIKALKELEALDSMIQFFIMKNGMNIAVAK
ncbi:MAG: hypothetical protein GY710_18970 [Desulfobacteraceae bacterium]|nr:hypothetical protein [Desulfobacteraceae bacterium]